MVLSVSSRALLDACARRGLDTQEILDAAKLDAATIQAPDARIPIEQVDALWRKAYALSNDPNSRSMRSRCCRTAPMGSSTSSRRTRRRSGRRSRKSPTTVR